MCKIKRLPPKEIVWYRLIQWLALLLLDNSPLTVKHELLACRVLILTFVKWKKKKVEIILKSLLVLIPWVYFSFNDKSKENFGVFSLIRSNVHISNTTLNSNIYKASVYIADVMVDTLISLLWWLFHNVYLCKT